MLPVIVFHWPSINFLELFKFGEWYFLWRNILTTWECIFTLILIFPRVILWSKSHCLFAIFPCFIPKFYWNDSLVRCGCLDKGGLDKWIHFIREKLLFNAYIRCIIWQAIQQLQARTPHVQSTGNTVPVLFLVDAALDIYQTLVVELDTEGRYLFLNAVANQLRYPNNHTHYFSFVLLYLFAELNQVKGGFYLRVIICRLLLLLQMDKCLCNYCINLKPQSKIVESTESHHGTC